MRIYVDGIFFRRSGIGRILDCVLRTLVDAPEVDRVYTLVPLERESEFRSAFPSGKIEAKFIDCAPLGYADFFRKGSLIRSFLPEPDLFYFPNFNVPFFLRGRILSTLCDLIPLSPWLDLPWHKRLGFRFLIGRSIRRSIRTVCISEFTRDQAEERFRVDRSRLPVIYPWVEEDFAAEPERFRGEKPLQEGDYVLFVGNRFPHKNIRCLTEALRRLSKEHPGLKLVVAGARMRRRDDVDEALGDPMLKNRVVEFPEPTDEQVKNLYAHARVFAFPTYLEGFGIPPLEARCYGIPVVCSDIPVLREVCGESVTYADPNDPGSFARGIASVLGRGGADSVAAPGRPEGDPRFRREIIASQYLDLFLRCVRE